MDEKEPVAMAEGLELTEHDLTLINHFALKTLTAEEVFAFAVRLCDNEIDRDGERFPEATLRELSKLYVGKTGLFDHSWTAKGQTARLFRTELVKEEGRRTRAGDPYCYLKGYAYMLKSEETQELIAEILGGIKKEVSVGCAVGEQRCSICGSIHHECEHRKGQSYGGKLCFIELVKAIDAYEWSFVAVPAQRTAGVIKRYSGVPEPEETPPGEGDRALLSLRVRLAAARVKAYATQTETEERE